MWYIYTTKPIDHKITLFQLKKNFKTNQKLILTLHLVFYEDTGKTFFVLKFKQEFTTTILPRRRTLLILNKFIFKIIL